jgi:hypothetical protein
MTVPEALANILVRLNMLQQQVNQLGRQGKLENRKTK